MADNLFDEFDPSLGAAPPAPEQQPDAGPNLFDEFDPEKPGAGTDSLGAFGRGAALGVAPAVGGLAGAGAGAASLGAMGFALGGPVGAGIGAFIGGVGGGFGGSIVASQGQEWAIQALPDSWKDPILEQRALDEEYHPTEAFLGGLLPQVLTMKPGFGAAVAKLPANATAFERILAHPITGRVFGGAVMGGVELGSEVVSGNAPDWTKIGIATGFGIVFNRQNRLGDKITAFGERGVISAGKAVGVEINPVFEIPTIAQAADAKVMGPGITEEVFMGTQAQAPEAAMTAQSNARTEASILGTAKIASPDVHDIARQMEPETFAAYDAMAEQRASLRDYLATIGESPEAPGVRARISQIDVAMREVEPEVSASYRRAADAVASEVVEPDVPAPVAAPAENVNPVPGAEAAAPTLPLDQQFAFIAQEVTQQLIAIGRSPDFARAEGQLSAHRAMTRAARRGDPLNALSLWQAEGPTFRAGGKVPTAAANELAQRGTLEQGAVPASNIETPEFREWFGKSKTVTSEGKPEVFYHGTTSNFDEFARVDGGNQYGAGYYFTKSPEAASNYAMGTNVSRMTPEGEGAPNVIPAYLKIEKPFRTRGLLSKAELNALERAVNEETSGYFARGELAKMFDRAYPPNGDNVMYNLGPAPQAALRRAGYDAIDAPDMTVVFEPTQIKSQFNRGTFDPDDPRILYQDRELEQGKRGSITFREGRKPIIKLFADADASTAIHETGHQWLEELMRDAVHQQASDVVKTDAATVKKWLGIEGDKIETRQHEKFARGFEQYMREGVAPNAGLARVFAQFKTWLTQIYQSIRGLGAPINEDIKAVFDRMIEMEPQRTVIAPEREGAAGISAIHEADAEQAHPADAEPIGDRISAERQAYIAQQPQEIINELAAAEQAAAATAAPDAGAEGGAGPAGSAPVLDAGGKPDPLAPSGDGSGQPGALGEGIAQGTGEGIGAPAGGGAATGAGLRNERPGAAGAARANPLAPGASPLFTASESRFVDKAGNIRLDNLNTTEDVRMALRDMAAANNNFGMARRDGISPGQIYDLAQDLGMGGALDKVQQWTVGQAWNAEEIYALRGLIKQSGEDMSRTSKAVAEGGGDDSVLAYVQAKQRLLMVQTALAGVTAEWGRAGHAFRMMKKELAAMPDQMVREATGKTLFQMKQEAMLASKLDSPEKIAKFSRESVGWTPGRGLFEVWINGLLSGWVTQPTYLIGNTVNAVLKTGLETPTAALIGYLREKGGRTGERVYAGEVGAQIEGYARAVPGALKAALDTGKTGVRAEAPTVKPEGEDITSPYQELAPSPTLNDNLTFRELGSELASTVQSIQDAIIATGNLVKAGGDSSAPLVGARFSLTGVNPDIQVRGVTVLPIGTVTRLPSRINAMMDSFFHAFMYSADRNAIAFRTGTQNGLDGRDLAAYVAQQRANPDPAIIEKSAASARAASLMGKGGELTQRLSMLANAKIFGFPFLKFVMPFTKFIGNVMDYTLIQRTPLGWASPELRADLLGKNGNIAQDTAMAKMAVGTALSIGFGAAAAAGNVTGSGPVDQTEGKLWRLAGNQPHSIRIGNMWYNIWQLGPVGMLASLSADLYDTSQAVVEGDTEEATSRLIHAFAQNVLDASAMRGPSDMLQAINDPDRYGNAWVSSFTSSFVPFSTGMGQAARALDPWQRDARNAIDAIKARIPGLSQEVAARRDVWGEMMPTAKGFLAIYMQQMTTDPVNIAMQEGGYFPGTLRRDIRGVDLTTEQYDLYAMTAGRMAKKRLDAIVTSGQWRTWPAQVKHDVIEETIRQSRETARGFVMSRFPQIAVDAVRAKMKGID